jgi:hypothetical protein
MAGPSADQRQILQFLEVAREHYSNVPLVREWAVSQLGGVRDNDLFAQVKAILDSVKKHMVYVRDPVNAEYVISPIQLIQTIMSRGVARGDCDDHVMLLNSALGSIGFPTKFVGVKFPPGQATEFNHVISGIIINGQMFLADPCAKDNNQLVYKDTLTV